MYKILMVDDDAKNLKATQSFLKIKGYEVVTTSSATEAIEFTTDDEFALVLLDYQMPNMMGDVLATMIHKVSPHQQIAMYSCDTSRDAVKSSMRAGAVDFIDKSMAPEELLKLIESYCHRYEALYRTIRATKNKSENKKIIESVGMVGQSQALAETAITIQRLAASADTSVLIHGESGTGKELVAKALHKLSARSSGPFVAINCGAIPKDLLESELFGHLKGSFTGATHDKQGKFVQANRGTIFLDEIGDMPPELQVKLLRVLQEREVVPVGGKIPQKIDVRILSATHKKLEEMVAKGQFREDLMYRIKVIEIEVPALRNRPDDIEPLVAHFTDVFNKKQQTKKHFQRRTLETLKRYPWPGNIRELQSVVEKHLVVSPNTMIRPEDFDLKLYQTTTTTLRGMSLSKFRQLQSEDELRFLTDTIEQAGGNKAEAARRLEIKPNHLQHLLGGSKTTKTESPAPMAQL